MNLTDGEENLLLQAGLILPSGYIMLIHDSYTSKIERVDTNGVTYCINYRYENDNWHTEVINPDGKAIDITCRSSEPYEDLRKKLICFKMALSETEFKYFTFEQASDFHIKQTIEQNAEKGEYLSRMNELLSRELIFREQQLQLN